MKITDTQRLDWLQKFFTKKKTMPWKGWTIQFGSYESSTGLVSSPGKRSIREEIDAKINGEPVKQAKY